MSFELDRSLINILIFRNQNFAYKIATNCQSCSQSQSPRLHQELKLFSCIKIKIIKSVLIPPREFVFLYFYSLCELRQNTAEQNKKIIKIIKTFLLQFFSAQNVLGSRSRNIKILLEQFLFSHSAPLLCATFKYFALHEKNHSRAFQIKNLIKRNLGKLPYWGTMKIRSRPQLPTSGNHRAKASSEEVRRLQIKKIHESQTGQKYRWKLIKFSSRGGKCGLQYLC